MEIPLQSLLLVNIVLAAAAAVLALCTLLKKPAPGVTASDLDELRRELTGEMRESRKETTDNLNESLRLFSDTVTKSQSAADNTQKTALQALSNQTNQQMDTLRDTVDKFTRSVNESLVHLRSGSETQLEALRQSVNSQLQAVRDGVDVQLRAIRETNEKQLGEMRATVDEKLQQTLESRLTQSFKLVSERLEEVSRGLGEMQSVANSVGDLKKVLSNVKTRGILGEVQLGAILEQIMAPGQYAQNVAVTPGSPERVEYAICLPGGDDGKTVYLPIDAKFPGDMYEALMDAYDSANPEKVEAAAKNLERRIKQEAKDIRDKYIDPPYSTDFAIMFLPVEGLYAEVVRRGLIELLQREYKVNIAGPTTMAALLNSLQMGFKTLSIQKRSSEVWNVLGQVKTEFGKFQGELEKAQKNLRQTSDQLEKLVGTRTRAIQRRLQDVEALPVSTEGEQTFLPFDDEDGSDEG